MNRLIEDFTQSLHKGFIDKNVSHQGNFTPKLLINNKNENVLSTIVQELQKCISFSISVAFITESGLASLKSILYDLNRKGIKGRILTSNYLGFNSPKMYSELLKLENVEVRLTDVEGFHAKGYIFDHENYSSMIIGSSNLTSNALKINYEHNILLSTHRNGELVHNIKSQFNDLWDKSISLTQKWIDDYKETFEYKSIKQIFELQNQQKVLNDKYKSVFNIQPNKMQKEALSCLDSHRKEGKDRSLIISATGTGKTILCALDVRAFNPEKFLFIVHNEGILNRAREEFQKVMPHIDDNEFGLLTGKHKNVNAKYLFATIQTLSNNENFKAFSKEHFDYIVFDEAHRSAASSYQRIFNYFTPKFMLGMTATPERSDDLNIYELFDYNVAFEIRLQEALESEILCPFHYFGVTDYSIGGEISEEVVDLKNLTSDERLQNILDKTNYYGYSGEELKGLIFVSRRDEAYELAQKLTDHGIPSVGLTGKDKIELRSTTIERLKNGEISYIITVDLFNEGIDIPEVNQVVMLRPTESSIIFIQQLGRGLRKSNNKEYVTVIDFIGNYKTNYLIPVALSGDQSQNKDSYKKFLTSNSELNGVSTINFEEIAKKKIYDSLDAVKLNQPKLIREAYETVQNRIGRLPMLMDFIRQNSIDPSVIFSKYKNYHEFLLKNKYIEDKINLNEFKNLTFLSRQLTPGLKKVDILVLEEILKGPIFIKELLEKMRKLNDDIIEKDVITSLKILDFSLFKSTIGDTYGEPLINIENDKIQLTKEFSNSLNNPLFLKYIFDLIELSKYNNRRYQDSGNRMIIYNKYSREDFVKLLNWDSDESGTINGYKMKHQTLPIFITYDKHEDISDNTKYEDEFLSQDELKWYTRLPRKIQSPEIQNILNHVENNVTMYIFVKKKDDDGKYFYYLGTANYIEGTEEEDIMPNGNSVVTMKLSMYQPVRDDIYRYITSD
ncbi:DEAD/DEAH box helicase [Staphylococcus pasteuri]|uniref:DEAD/DEAH box helicase n=1 Tax=Staphylococcus pasteuri TaxID=45972 RepID=UPI001C2798A0|nr:DEAD/DEAH box helicase [Staphylococcus pasteuri]MCO0861197.1 DEAD/DEAH box helicase [Staphylococcus pasteuri]MCO5360303.1 DEAD/DEAH box helicase [Staphylococcus pasteuri]